MDNYSKVLEEVEELLEDDDNRFDKSTLNKIKWRVKIIKKNLDEIIKLCSFL